jgi:hypothetical protein
MSLNGPAFYENALNFTTYIAHRHQADNPPDTLEKPVLLDLVGAVGGKRILDLGCGDHRAMPTLYNENRAGACATPALPFPLEPSPMRDGVAAKLATRRPAAGRTPPAARQAAHPRRRWLAAEPVPARLLPPLSQ